MKVPLPFCISALCILLFSTTSLAVNELFPNLDLTEKIEEINLLSYSDLNKAIELTESLSKSYEPPVPFEVIITLVDLYKLDRQWDKAKSIINKTLLSHLSENQQLRLKALQLEFAYKLPDLKDQHTEFYQEVEQKVPGIESVKLKANMYSGLALFNLHNQEFSLSEAFITQAIDVYPQSNYVLAGYYQTLGIDQAQQQKLHEALKSFIQADKIYKDINLQDNYKLMLNIGGLLIYMKQWENAIDYSLRALKAAQKPNFKIHNNLGTAYFYLERYEEAEAQFLESISVSEKQMASKISALTNLGSIYEKRAQYDKANQIYLQLEGELISKEKWGQLITIYSKLGRTFDLLDRNIQANKYYQKALDLIAETDQGTLISRVDVYSGMIDNLERLKEFEQAYFKLKEFKSFNDARIENSNRDEAEQLQTKWELANKQRELLEIERDQQLKQQKIEALENEQHYQKQTRFYMLVILVLLGIAIVSLVILLTYRNKAHKKLAKQNDEIFNQKNALTILNVQLKQQSLEDPLTGLNNRRYLNEIMQIESKKFARNSDLSTASSMLVILLDIDHFKNVNDTFGHGFGDDILQFVGHAMQTCARESDFLIRWGGEEFVWVCTNAKFAEGPELCARLQSQLSKKLLPFADGTIALSASYGFAPYPISSSNFQFTESLTLADNALYEAKTNGRNAWVGYQLNDNVEFDSLNKKSIKQLIDKAAITTLSGSYNT